MVNLIHSFRDLKRIKVFVVGDFVLDTYITGYVGRISPEAPVPVLHAKDKKSIPGMAGNVALNLVSLGADVYVSGRVGADPEGKLLVSYLKAESIDTSCIVVQKKYQTPVKHRMIANAQQLLRVDFEEVTSLTQELENKLIRLLQDKLDHINVIALSDYKKGFLTKTLIHKVITLARQKNIPIIVDPKGEDFSKYKGCSLIKPNLQEAYAAAKCSRDHSLDAVAEILLKEAVSDHLLITRSEEGMSLFSHPQLREDFPVESREVKDVTGAGDTVLAMMAMGMGNGLSLSCCAQLSNVAASLAVQKVGCVRVTLSQVAEQLFLMDHSHKIFAEEHLFALNQVLVGKTFSILGLDLNQTMTTELFQTIKKLSCKDPNHRLILYLADTKERENLISLLASLHEVHFILLSSQHLSQFLDKITPEKSFYIKENSVSEIHNPLHLLDHLLLEKII
jgi:D-beta-D-heptose 7-phosphate kinase/D-beta-D-heptose 1-phosphate adenosyltransferase